jgi:hypothetical protein
MWSCCQRNALWEIIVDESDATADGGGLRIQRCPGLAWLLLQFLMSGYGQGLFVAARVAELSDGFIGSPRERLRARGSEADRKAFYVMKICSGYWTTEMNIGVAHSIHRFVPH